uniref:Uncharacterized protein n=1 Tax=Aegilops tauschii subsp. strangulata TaxID=200361 RepID=A0A453LX14_AEGTS
MFKPCMTCPLLQVSLPHIILYKYPYKGQINTTQYYPSYNFYSRDVFLRELERSIGLVAGFNPADVCRSSRLAAWASGAVHCTKECRDTVFGILDGIIAEHQERVGAGAGDAEDTEGRWPPVSTRHGLHQSRHICSHLVCVCVCAGHIWRRQRDVDNNAVVDNGGTGQEPKGDASSHNGGAASLRGRRQGGRAAARRTRPVPAPRHPGDSTAAHAAAAAPPGVPRGAGVQGARLRRAQGHAGAGQRLGAGPRRAVLA